MIAEESSNLVHAGEVGLRQRQPTIPLFRHLTAPATPTTPATPATGTTPNTLNTLNTPNTPNTTTPALDPRIDAVVTEEAGTEGAIHDAVIDIFDTPRRYEVNIAPKKFSTVHSNGLRNELQTAGGCFLWKFKLRMPAEELDPSFLRTGTAVRLAFLESSTIVWATARYPPQTRTRAATHLTRSHPSHPTSPHSLHPIPPHPTHTPLHRTHSAIHRSPRNHFSIPRSPSTTKPTPIAAVTTLSRRRNAFLR